MNRSYILVLLLSILLLSCTHKNKIDTPLPCTYPLSVHISCSSADDCGHPLISFRITNTSDQPFMRCIGQSYLWEYQLNRPDSKPEPVVCGASPGSCEHIFLIEPGASYEWQEKFPIACSTTEISLLYVSFDIFDPATCNIVNNICDHCYQPIRNANIILCSGQDAP